MKKGQQKLMTDLNRLLETQNFKTKEELSKFMDSLIGQEIPSFPEEVLNFQEQAQDLVYKAYDSTPAKAKTYIEKALQLDPDCIEAYEYLGLTQSTTELACVFYEKAIAIGRRVFGGKYLEEHRGMFWGFHETRPFMRCLQLYSECLYDMGREQESVNVLEEMIILNPNDNQGVRDQLMLYLIELNEDKKFLKYMKMYPNESRAFPLFNNALFAFKTEGVTENSKKILLKALKQNKFVAKRLLAIRPVRMSADHYGFGDENEADYYASYAQGIWARTKGANTWLKMYSRNIDT